MEEYDEEVVAVVSPCMSWFHQCTEVNSDNARRRWRKRTTR